MHPILADLRRLGLYLLAWVPVAVFLTVLFAATASFTWISAAVFAAPLVLIYAFWCLSAWYLCRYVPLGSPHLWGLVIAVHPAAAIMSLAWAGGVAWGVAALEGLTAEYLPQRLTLFAVGVVLYYLATALHYVLMAIQVKREAEERRTEAMMLARDAELRALRAQINPHFLFNSLNAISALTASDPAMARQMCMLLSDFLRSSLGIGERESIPLGEELALARGFLAIQQVRFGARLSVLEQVDPALDGCLVPPLILQPLVENAITHGVATLVEGGWIRIVTRAANGELRVMIENSFDPEAPRRQRTGLGLPNVRKRLAARYGEAARLEVRQEEERRFRVKLALPLETEVRDGKAARGDR